MAGLSDMCILVVQGSDCSPLVHTSDFERQPYIKKHSYCNLSKIWLYFGGRCLQSI